MMSRQILITTGARLHFGLLSHGLEGTSRFGGAGLMIDSPGFEVSAEVAGDTSCLAPDPFRKRVAEFVSAYQQNCRPEHRPPACRLEVLQAIPSHVGLGSGTQLGMAVAQALSLLSGEVGADPASLAQRVGRGLRSAVGVHGFSRGGFVVDAGKVDDTSIGSVLSRVEFPSLWRFLLVSPQKVSGLWGKAEREAFARLPPMPQRTTDQLRETLLEQLLPAIIEADFATCAESLFQYGQRVGEYFAPPQGGVYCEKRMAELAADLRANGFPGVGQTSWGPTIFVLCKSANDAEPLRTDLVDDARFQDCDCRVVAPMNTGASVETR